MEIPDGYLTVAEVAARCNVPRTTLYEWLRKLPEATARVEVSPGCYRTYVDPKPFERFKRES